MPDLPIGTVTVLLTDIETVTVLRAAGVADRSEVVGGGFFQAVSDGGDTCLLKAVLHHWDDEAAAAILRTCRRALGATGTLLVIERVLGPPNEGAEAKVLDLQMLVGTGGRERPREEWATLFASAGEVSVIEGAPVERGRS